MRSKILPALFILWAFYLLFFSSIYAQKPPTVLGGKSDGIGGGPIVTGAPFLLIAPDSRSGALGDLGVASSPDAYSQHWNAAKYAFMEEDMNISLSYSPWLLNLVPDMSLAYLTVAKKIDSRSAFAATLLYFSLGTVYFQKNKDDIPTPYTPNEFAIDASYSRQLIDELSIAVTGRFIFSNLTLGQGDPNGGATKPAIAGAADISLFYTKEIGLGSTLEGGRINFGLNLSNIGSKLSYSSSSDKKEFLPANLRLGLGFEIYIDDYNKVAFMGEINKLMVPTTPIRDSSGLIVQGMDTDVGTITGILHSFYDAPLGFKEEMQEVMWSLGAEYWYNNLLAFRLGYFHESKAKGARQYLTIGAGFHYNVFGIDFSYLIPTLNAANNPLKNTLRFSLTFDFNTKKKQK